MKNLSLAKKMLIALVLGLIAGWGCMMLRENLIAGGNQATWTTINRILFQDISAEGATTAVGIFYIIGQLFINSLQLIIVPMVFTSITLAICNMKDTNRLGRISTKTISTFLLTTVCALMFAGVVGAIIYKTGAFNPIQVDGITINTGSTGSNPLNILLSVVPNNVVSAFSSNGGVLAIVFIAVCMGLAINALGDQVTVLTKLLQEINQIITVCLTAVINKFGPIAIFVLLTRTFAIYGIDYLKPALAYVVTCVLALFTYLFVAYPIYIRVLAKLNPMPFIKKIVKVALFGFSTTSSAATFPLNKKTTVDELGVHDEIASFVLPLGMTINMDGTAIMQVIAAIFVASTAGYDISVASVGVIALLALVSSVGTPAAPGAGAIILFTILTGMGYTNDAALLAYSLILAINRPIEMLVTSLNVVGDSTTSIVVAKYENQFDEDTYNKEI